MLKTMNNLFPQNKNKQQLERILTAIANELDLPDAMFEKVEKRYKNVSEYIGRPNSIVSQIKPHIYVHGSFALGTMIKPSNDCSEFDIDCICKLELSSNEVSQKKVKEWVGYEINNYIKSQSFNKGLKEWDKCWTMEYSDSDYVFKMDFVPAIPSENVTFTSTSPTSIYITDKKHPYYNKIYPIWKKGNPKAYAAWFKTRMLVRLNEMKRAIAKDSYLMRGYAMDAEEIPDYKVKTPLQRAVQLLKRHRDIYFKDNENRPSSIILTTLAAKAYENDESLVDSMDKIIKGMRSHIEVRGEVYWVPNPVDTSENLAESWSDCNVHNAFFEWLKKLEQDWASTYNHTIITNRLFEEQYGQWLTNRVFVNMGITPKENYPLAIDYNVPHRKKPSWPMHATNYVYIKGRYSPNGEPGTWQPFESGVPLRKRLKLRFFAETNASSPYTAYWQVVNTGEEAEAANCLRGDFYTSKTIGSGGLNSCTALRDEYTEYKGVHWVQCFIVNNGGLCIAKSDPFIVNIQ